MVIIIEGTNIHDQPEKVEVPDSLGRAILETKANANKISTDPEGAVVFIDHPDSVSTRIAIAPDTSPAAVITINTKWSQTNPRYTVAIDVDQDKVVAPLAGKFPGLNGHTTNLVLRKKK